MNVMGLQRHVGMRGVREATSTRSRGSLALVAWLALSLAASPNGLAAGPQPASPQGLPPDTVDQAGLWWGLNTVGTQGATKPFRFSLCEGRYLEAGEVSRPCDPSRARTVAFGHDAPFVFSPGHNTFLPPGLSIDGNGILTGDDPERLANLDIPMCVRQLHVEQCRTIHLRNDSKPILIEQRPIAEAIDNGSSPAKKGMGKGGALLVVGGLALAAGGIAVAASAAQLTEDGSTGGGGGGMTYLDSQGIVCLYNAGGVLSNCSGNVLVNITNKVAAGSTLRLSGSFWGGNRTISTSPPGSINFFLTGGAGSSCPGPLTSLALVNLSQSTSTVIATAGGFSIPVTCR
jgi:hypothetical protein